MDIAHFYHVYADGTWQVPIHEHFFALRTARLPGELHLSVVGSEENQERVEKYVVKYWGKVDSWSTSLTGFEDLALNRALEWSKERPEGRVLYMHSKGAYHQDLINDMWRMSMTSRLLGPWELRLNELDNFDAVGLHWLTSADTDLAHGRRITTPMFGGNFWWARADYLAKLPELPILTEGTRFEAEAWIGRGNPRVKDLSPGWPTY